MAAYKQTVSGMLNRYPELRAPPYGHPFARLDSAALTPLLENGAVKRAGRGRSRVRPQPLIGDKGDSSAEARP